MTQCCLGSARQLVQLWFLKREHVDSVAYCRMMVDPVIDDPVDPIHEAVGDDTRPIAVVVAGGAWRTAASVVPVHEIREAGTRDFN